MLLFLRSTYTAQGTTPPQLLTLNTRLTQLPLAWPAVLLLRRWQPRNNLETTKIKFKRKGGWIRSFKNWSTPYLFKFGFGHLTTQLGIGVYRHRHKRYLTQHCMLWSHCPNFQSPLVKFAVQVKPFNCYTLRGIRTSRFFLLKRKGKESKYTHLKSKIF